MKGCFKIKKYCKNINITDRDLISRAVYTCIDDKYTRPDTLHMFKEYSGIKSSVILELIKSVGKHAVYPIIETVIDGMRQELINKEIIIKPIWYKEKIDPSSFKIRRIGIQDVKQQIYDYIAVEGLSPFLCRIGEYQCAAIKGRGQIKGVNIIKRWMRNKNIRYAGKADIRKCYESISKRQIMRFLKKHIKNDLLLWLINKLISTFEFGLSIGSYLSQFLCNLYMSQLYHEISENMYRVRKHRDGTSERVNLIKHVIFYMDDILILGTNAKDVHKAMDLIIKFSDKKLGLEIKSSWTVFMTKIEDKKNDNGQFIDMMGFRIYRWHVTIRRRVFKRIRRNYMLVRKMIKTHKKIPLIYARRCISYNGQIKNSDSFKFKRKYHVNEIIKVCKKVVRKYDKGKIYYRTATC